MKKKTLNRIAELSGLKEGPIDKEHYQNFLIAFGYPKVEFFKLLIKLYKESSEGSEYEGKPLTAENANEYMKRLSKWAEENLYLNSKDKDRLFNFIAKSEDIQTDLTEDKTEEEYSVSFRVGPKHTLKEIIGLLTMLKSMGSMGSSRRIGVEDDKGWDSFDFDGDGQSWLDDIKVNGEELGDNWEEKIKKL